MLNVPELEKRWKRYRRRKKAPLYLFTAVSVAMIGAGLYFAYAFTTHKGTAPVQAVVSRKAASAAASSSKPSVTVAVAEVSPVSAAPSSTEKIEQKQAVTVSAKTPTRSTASKPKAKPTKLQPSMEFMEDFEADVMDYYFQDDTAAPATKAVPVQETTDTDKAKKMPSQHLSGDTALPSLHRTKTQTQKPTVVASEPVKIHPARKSVKQPALSIQRESDMKDIQDVIARFKKNKNPALSLFIAKRYYAIGNYQKAYNYALITNELDSDIEDSWLIFAKSLYKLDQKEMAVKTLKTYQSESGSVKARITLEQMESGTFE